MFVIDNLSRVPVYEQIIKQVEGFIMAGVLPPDASMPSVRAVASETSSNPNTVQKAYTQMLGRGLIYAVPGRGSFVSSDACDLIREKYKKNLIAIEEMAKEFAGAGIDKQLVLDAVERGYRKKG